MKKICVLLVIWCMVSLPMQGGINFDFESGLATFDMTLMKELNKDICSSLPFEAKIVSNFEPYFYWKPSVSVLDDVWIYGLTYSFQSSGSRVSVGDYSGEYRMDLRVQSNNIGGFMGAKLVSKKYFQTMARFEMGILYSKFSMAEHLELTDYWNTYDHIDAKGVNMYAEPSVRFYVGIKTIALFLNLGYQFQLDKEALYVGTKDYSLTDNHGRNLSVNWSGLRLGLGLSIRL